MFFILSKVLYFLIVPLNWVAGLLIYTIFGKSSKWKKRCRNFAVILLLFFCNHFIFNLVINAWETEVKPVTSLETYDIGIILGGYSNFEIYPRDRYNFSKSANRLTQALELYKKGLIKKMLLTGGSGSILLDDRSEALEVESFLLTMGVPKEDIILEPDSRNTHENAVFTKAILDRDYPNAKCLMITSAFHMRRSKACFEKEKVVFTPFSTDVIAEKNRITPNSIFFPNRDGFWRWEMLIKEWVGYVVYWLRGYI
jgi:uncharacterized SAM-binding protein YcdF (DUF218 family)